jgi:murein tripeptide amidase MpaA
MENYLRIMTGSGGLKQLQEKWFKSNDWMKDLPDLDFFREIEKGKYSKIYVKILKNNSHPDNFINRTIIGTKQ